MKGRARHRLWRICASVGVIVAFLIADVAAGQAWGRVFPARRTGPVAQVNDRLGGADPTARDDRVDTPAMAGVSWADEYFAEFRSIQYDYWPFLLNRPRSFRGKYFNLDDWERKTWQPPGDAEGRPVVWFFGGSALWGEGQRDLHTIPSEIARLAAADDLPISAVNYGQSGWVLHQEVALLSQLLNRPGTAQPSLIAFYDGANDVSVQAQRLAGGEDTADAAVPSHFGIANAIEATSGAAASPSPAPTPDAADGLIDAYKRNSLALRGLRAIVGSDPAGAQATDEIGQAAVDKAIPVYREDRAVATFLGADAGASVHTFWQPEGFDLPGYREAAARVGPPTVDLTGVLDGEDDLFMDLVHTNERGAALVAKAMYEHLRPDLVRWYREHPGG